MASKTHLARCHTRNRAGHDSRNGVVRQLPQKRGGVDRSANTTPGNKKVDFPTSSRRPWLNCEIGSSAITGVLSPGEKLKDKGLIYAANTPASDFICGTLQLAAGMNMHVFTTGRGTPYGLAAVPVVKAATRNRASETLARPHGYQRRQDR